MSQNRSVLSEMMTLATDTEVPHRSKNSKVSINRLENVHNTHVQHEGIDFEFHECIDLITDKYDCTETNILEALFPEVTSKSETSICRTERTDNYVNQDSMMSTNSCLTKIDSSVVHGTWEESEVGKSSTWRELEAVRRVLLSNLVLLCNKHITIRTDNQNITRILLSGSNVAELHKLCLNVHSICNSHNITFATEWIPRGQNQLADHLSRCLDCDDWCISKSVFRKIDMLWGPHSVDRFSSHYNNNCKRFNSRWWVPGTEAINSLKESWVSENNWLVPPPYLIADCFRKIEDEACTATIVIPEWESAPFWSFIVDEHGNYNKCIKHVYVLPSTGAVVQGRGNNGVFSNEPFSFRMLALRCSYKD